MKKYIIDKTKSQKTREPTVAPLCVIITKGCVTYLLFLFSAKVLLVEPVKN